MQIKTLKAEVSEEYHREARAIAARLGTTVKDVLTGLFTAWMEEQKRILAGGPEVEPKSLGLVAGVPAGKVAFFCPKRDLVVHEQLQAILDSPDPTNRNTIIQSCLWGSEAVSKQK